MNGASCKPMQSVRVIRGNAGVPIHTPPDSPLLSSQSGGVGARNMRAGSNPVEGLELAASPPLRRRVRSAGATELARPALPGCARRDRSLESIDGPLSNRVRFSGANTPPPESSSVNGMGLSPRLRQKRPHVAAAARRGHRRSRSDPLSLRSFAGSLAELAEVDEEVEEVEDETSPCAPSVTGSAGPPSVALVHHMMLRHNFDQKDFQAKASARRALLSEIRSPGPGLALLSPPSPKTRGNSRVRMPSPLSKSVSSSSFGSSHSPGVAQEHDKS